MGLMAVYPKPHLSQNPLAHQRFPYLLKGVAIVRSNQVWSTDITYIRLLGGFVYLAAVIDWFSRYVLAWELSTTLEVGFCVAVVERALTIQRPEIFNTDQGVQFTSAPFQAPLLAAQVKLSMDGRGRLFDNIFVERLWRSVKYEEVFLHDYQNVGESRRGLGSTSRSTTANGRTRRSGTARRTTFISACRERSPTNLRPQGGACYGAPSPPPCSF